MASDSSAPCPKCGTWHDVEQECLVCLGVKDFKAKIGCIPIVRQEAALPAPEE